MLFEHMRSGRSYRQRCKASKAIASGEMPHALAEIEAAIDIILKHIRRDRQLKLGEYP